MAIISIKKFLVSNNETERALTHGLRALIRGIADHTIPGEPEEAARFQEGIQKVSDTLENDITQEELMVQVGSLVRALEDHNRRTARRHQQHSAELQNMVTMLTAALADVSAGSETNVKKLGEIEKRISSASQLDDVRLIRTRLADCLVDLRSEVERQRKETQAAIHQLSEGLEQARKSSGEARANPGADEITGLPSRPAAEAALAQASESGETAFAAVLVLDRLQGLNVRFGREVGDEVLRVFARALRRELSGDLLFRWGGPVFLALLRRATSIDRARCEIARTVDSKVEHTIETGSRSIMIPIVPRWAVFPTSAAPRLICQRIDTFASVGALRE